MASILRIGTRGSPLALAQAASVEAALKRHTADQIEIVPIRTSGDRPSQRSLAEEGGKGLFTKEIEEALIAGAIDLAVHSLKDMATELPAGLVIAGCLERGDPRDALVGASGIAALAQGAIVGTAALRRKAQLLMKRPDLVVLPLRGNVGTRLQKLAAGECAATVLALAGLRRIGREDCVSAILSPEEMLPAAGQGIIAIETRLDDARTRGLVTALDHADTSFCALAERALLGVLDGSCRTPIAAYARIDGGRMRLDAMVLRPDGSEAISARREGAANTAQAMGEDAGRELRQRMGPGFFQ